MESKEEKSETESCRMVFQVVKEFLMCITKIEELGAVGSELLNGVQQGLGFLQRPPIKHTSNLLGSIIKNNETKRFQSYISAGCIKCEDCVQNMSRLHSCLRGLKDHLIEVKSRLNEVECLLKSATAALQTAIECSLRSKDNDNADELDHRAPDNKDETTSFCQQHEITDYAEMMAIIYSMLKQDYIMQEKIASSLTVTTSTSVLESYCLMWSLRPFVNDDVVRQAWRLIP